MSVKLGPEWPISKNGYDVLNESGNIKQEQLLKLALDSDFKEICNPILSTELSKERISKIVLQIQKIRNIAAPKANEESQAAPRLLKLSLTDGETYVQALEISPLNSISRNNTPPGTKLLINNAKVSLGYLLLTPQNCSLLGGRVPALIEKWELAKTIKSANRRNSNEDGPPPWVNFGCKIRSNAEENNFKSLGAKSKDAKENSEFELQRQGAIAEATSGAIKKVFGGRVSQNVQAAKNPVRTDRRDTAKHRNKLQQKDKDIEEKLEKPQVKVSLFSFLEDKLPVSEPSTFKKDAQPKVNYNPSQNQHNFDLRNDSNKQTNRSDYQNRSEYSHNKNTVKNFNANGYLPRGSYRNPPKQFQNPSSGNYQRNSQQRDIRGPIKETKEAKSEVTAPSKRTNISNNEPNIAQNGNVNLGSKSSNQNDRKIEETTQLMSKVSLNSQFASRSLRQHLNLGHQKHHQNQNDVVHAAHSVWNIGDYCMAKYWEDGKFYNAEIVNVTDTTVVVKFAGYGNIEEVLSTDCLPVGQRNPRPHNPGHRNEQNNRSYSGTMEFRRSSRNFN